jgi:hypothetical protein
LSLTVQTCFTAIYELPLLIGILTITKIHLISLAAFLVLVISLLQATSLLLFELALRTPNADEVCQASFSLFRTNCGQVSLERPAKTPDASCSLANEFVSLDQGN